MPATGSTTWTSPAAATRSTATTRSVEKFIVECLRYWVARDARRRLPLRPRLDPVARPGRRADGRSAGPVADRASRRRWPTPRSSPKPGTPAACTRSATSPASAGPSGTAASATTSGASCKRRRRDGRRGRGADRRQRRHLPGRRRAADQQHQLHHLPTTASRSTTWSRTTRSTTRPTARTTATAPTTTSAGTAASKGDDR